MTNFLKKHSSIIKLISGITFGIFSGLLKNEILARTFATFNYFFEQLLNFSIPLIILAFIVYGTSNLKSKSKKLFATTIIMSYASTILMGIFAFFVASNILPNILAGKSILEIVSLKTNVTSYITGIKLLPVMDTMTALILSFIIGISLALKEKICALKNVFDDFHSIISNFISKIITPCLPVYVAGVFSKLSYSGQVFLVVNSFFKVYIVIFCVHFCAIFFWYFLAGLLTKKNPFVLIKNVIPAYLTAVGTQSSAASIPMSMNCMKKNNVKSEIAEFIASLCSTIHLPGCIMTITICSISIMIMTSQPFAFFTIIPFIILLSFMSAAAAGLPGGVIMASIGILSSQLGFSKEMISLMIILFVAQDSFGTGCNIAGDGAIGIIIDKISEDKK